MQWLFDHGAKDDVRTPDNEGRTPMNYDNRMILFEQGIVNRGDNDHRSYISFIYGVQIDTRTWRSSS